MSRLAKTIATRVLEPPLALQAHALLVLVASFVYADPQRGGWWAGPALVAIVLWPLLRGSRLVWWVQLYVVTASLLGLAGAWADVTDAATGFYVFLDATTLLLVTGMLAPALVLLLLPSVRRFCREDQRSPRSTFGFVLGVLLISAFPALAFSTDTRFPSSGTLEDVDDRVFVGGDEERGIAFYVGHSRGLVCLVTVRSDGSSRHCRRRSDLGRPGLTRSHDLIANLVSKEVVRVEVVTRSGAVQEAEIIADERAPANVFYVTDPPSLSEQVRIKGYDDAGNQLFVVP